MAYQKCPCCDGWGERDNPSHVAGDMATAVPDKVECPACEGRCVLGFADAAPPTGQFPTLGPIAPWQSPWPESAPITVQIPTVWCGEEVNLSGNITNPASSEVS